MSARVLYLIQKVAYYFSTHGCCLACSSLLSVGFGFEGFAAAAAARALLLKKFAAMALRVSTRLQHCD